MFFPLFYQKVSIEQDGFLFQIIVALLKLVNIISPVPEHSLDKSLCAHYNLSRKQKTSV